VRMSGVRGGQALALTAVVTLLLGACDSASAPPPPPRRAKPIRATRQAKMPRPAPPAPPAPPYAVGLRTITFVDARRTVQPPGESPRPRTLVTLVRYPAGGGASAGDHPGAPPIHRRGGFPLIVFGHGFAVTPLIYAPLLRAWARAGYVVAAPFFPLENAAAPGGPDESDLVNQPRDVSFLITRLLELSNASRGFLSNLLAPRAIAAAGQSDGGETALALGYDRYFRDHRVAATMILSGAQIPQVGVLEQGSRRPTPPLLATQGTADQINPPALTQAFFTAVSPPKYLLSVFGASHLGPYTVRQPGLRIVERVTVDFLDRYLKGAASAQPRMLHDGDQAGGAALTAVP